MNFKIKFTDEARKNYSSIKKYFDEFGTKVTNNFRQRLNQCFQLLEQNPNLFPLFDNQNQIRKAVLIKEVSVFYEIVKKEVHILAIINNRKKLPKF
ncbi:MAG: type II toxin-antitoxin system RelE/ParE family toxin [Balneolaceae bacterium]